MAFMIMIVKFLKANLDLVKILEKDLIYSYLPSKRGTTLIYFNRFWQCARLLIFETFLPHFSENFNFSMQAWKIEPPEIGKQRKYKNICLYNLLRKYYSMQVFWGFWKCARLLYRTFFIKFYEIWACARLSNDAR